MKLKKILSLAVSAGLIISSLGGSFSFALGRVQFPDVDENAWYGENRQGVVRRVCELGLMQGMGESFAPEQSVTLAEALAMAVRLNDIHAGGEGVFEQGDIWYEVYVKEAIARGIILSYDFKEYARSATRAEMAYIFASALPESAYAAINHITTLPDVGGSTPYGASILNLYNAGVLTGNDAQGTFTPFSPITRAQAAAIIVRAALPGERVSLSIAPQSSDWPGDYYAGMRVKSLAQFSALFELAVSNLVPSFEVILPAEVQAALASGGASLGVGSVSSELSKYDQATGRLSVALSYTLAHEVRTIIANPQKAASASEKAREYAQKIIRLSASVVPAGASQRDVYAAIHGYMTKNYIFERLPDTNGSWDFTGLLDNKTGSHWAFSDLFLLLAEAAKLPCESVSGLYKLPSGEYAPHSWNRVSINGAFLYIDASLDAPSSAGASPSKNYLLKTEAQFKADHVAR